MDVPKTFKPKQGIEEKTEDLLEGKIKKLSMQEDEILYAKISYHELTPKKLEKIAIPDEKIIEAQVQLRGGGWWGYNNRPKEVSDEICIIVCYSPLGMGKEETEELFTKIKDLHNIKHDWSIAKVGIPSANRTQNYYYSTVFTMPPLKKEDMKKILPEFEYRNASIKYKGVTMKEYNNSPTGGRILHYAKANVT